jgi:hypothetical protein
VQIRKGRSFSTRKGRLRKGKRMIRRFLRRTCYLLFFSRHHNKKSISTIRRFLRRTCYLLFFSRHHNKKSISTHPLICYFDDLSGYWMYSNVEFNKACWNNKNFTDPRGLVRISAVCLLEGVQITRAVPSRTC